MPQSSKRMNFQQFQTCLSAYFPGISISQSTMRAHLRPHGVNSFKWEHIKALTGLYHEFRLPYVRYYCQSLYMLDDLVIGFEGDHAKYSHGLSPTYPLYSEEKLLRLLKMASESGIFHYNKV